MEMTKGLLKTSLDTLAVKVVLSPFPSILKLYMFPLKSPCTSHKSSSFEKR